MSIAKSWLLVCALVLLCFGSKQTLRAQGGHRITGTYTNMYYNKEGGDVLGEELKIVVVQGVSSRQCCESCEVRVLVPPIACSRAESISDACEGNDARSART
jgi:hypothetical protein